MPTLSEKFAANLKTFRIAKKHSQESLAQKAGYSVSAISMLERGQRSAPLDSIERLARALGVRPLELLA